MAEHTLTEKGWPTIVSTAGYVPGEPTNNEELLRRYSDLDLKWTPERIEERTGFRQRYLEDGESLVAMSLVVAREALAAVGVTRPDSLYVATSSPDCGAPSTASLVAAGLGMRGEIALHDIGAACAGWWAGLRTASNEVQANSEQSALIIGAEVMTRITNFNDRKTAILFGNGAACALVQSRTDSFKPTFVSFFDPKPNIIGIPAGSSTIVMSDGPEVSRSAAAGIIKSMQTAAYRAGMGDPDGVIDWEKIDLFVPHPANRRIVDEVGEAIGVPEHKLVFTGDHYGNTSAAALPLSLSVAHQQERLKPGPNCVAFATAAAGIVGGVAIMCVTTRKV